MLSFDHVHIRKSRPFAVAPGVELTVEGCALVAAVGANGELAVKPSTGAAGERFLGLNINQTQHPDFLPHLESREAGLNSTTLVLSKAVADSGSLYLVATATDGSKVVLGAGDPATTAATYSIAGDGKTITLHTAQKDQAISAAYRYTPTVLEVNALQGEQSAGRTASALLGETTAIVEGEVATTEFDTSVAWAADVKVKLGANGLLTVGGSGTELTNVFVKEVPSEGRPFLTVVLL